MALFHTLASLVPPGDAFINICLGTHGYSTSVCLHASVRNWQTSNKAVSDISLVAWWNKLSRSLLVQALCCPTTCQTVATLGSSHNPLQGFAAEVSEGPMSCSDASG